MNERYCIVAWSRVQVAEFVSDFAVRKTCPLNWTRLFLSRTSLRLCPKSRDRRGLNHDAIMKISALFYIIEACIDATWLFTLSPAKQATRFSSP
jgi:hypothetical protein